MVKLLATAIEVSAETLERAGLLLYRMGAVLHDVLAALRSPADTAAAVRRYYQHTYYSPDSSTPNVVRAIGYELERWEVDVCARYGVDRGRLLVLGCGWGREAIVLAERGAAVVGLDFHSGVLALARGAAEERKVPARFVRGDFLSLPCRASSFDYILMAGTMYSAIAGRAARRAWLRQLGQLVKPGGLVILSFQPAHGSGGRLDRLAGKLKRRLAGLSGANSSYQDGDVYRRGHFFHLFQEEVELKQEFQEAGAVVRELCWPGQYAILSYE